VGYLVEDFLLFRIEGKQRQVFGVEETQDFFVQIEKDLVKIARGMDLAGDPLHMFRELDFLL
jgi:hypothetical protein